MKILNTIMEEMQGNLAPQGTGTVVEISDEQMPLAVEVLKRETDWTISDDSSSWIFVKEATTEEDKDTIDKILVDAGFDGYNISE